MRAIEALGQCTPIGGDSALGVGADAPIGGIGGGCGHCLHDPNDPEGSNATIGAEPPTWATVHPTPTPPMESPGQDDGNRGIGTAQPCWERQSQRLRVIQYLHQSRTSIADENGPPPTLPLEPDLYTSNGGVGGAGEWPFRQVAPGADVGTVNT